jgi:phosphoenolpyruvate phosphomutase
VLREIRPDYFIHGDDWKAGRLSHVRAQVIELLKEWGGELIEPAYTPGISSTRINDVWHAAGPPPEFRRDRLGQLFQQKEFIRIGQAPTLSTGGTEEGITPGSDARLGEMDALWWANPEGRGGPADSRAGFGSSLTTITSLLDSTVQPLIVEYDPEWRDGTFAYQLRTLERLGVSAVCLAGGPGSDAAVGLGAGPASLPELVAAARVAKTTDGFMIFVRLHIPQIGEADEDFFEIARACGEAGADGILVSGVTSPPKDRLGLIRSLRSQAANTVIIAGIERVSEAWERGLTDAGVQGVVYL